MKARFLTTVFSLLSIFVFSQQDSSLLKLEEFMQNVNTFSQYVPQEKVYLHTDNSDYFLGETIWFKAYVVTSGLHQPTIVSRVLYVELLTPEGEVAVSKKYEIINGQCHGEFRLDTRSFYSGFYELRAYTRYMLNFDKNIVFSRVLPVYSYPEEKGKYDERVITGSEVKRQVFRENPPAYNDIDIAFYPEGGNLVQGLFSQIAFKVTDKNGKSTNAEGAIYNSKMEVVRGFSTVHCGMGAFRFRPEVGERYTVEISDGKRTKQVSLPEPLPQGYVMNVASPDETQLNVSIERSPDLEAEVVGLGVLVRGQVYYFSSINFDGTNEVQLDIDTDNIPAGVAQLLLFDTQGHVLSDRLVFINKKDLAFTIRATPDKPTYAPLEKINIDFTLFDYQQHPISTIFSLSVQDRDSRLEYAHKENVLISMLLSSELKGVIENPGYYFASETPTPRLALDLLMLTQGWRRYKWEELTLQKPFELKEKVEKELIIDGVIKSRILEKPKPDMDIELMMFQRDTTGYYGENHFTGFARTDSIGNFEFKLASPIYGTWESLIQAQKKGERTKNDRIMLNRLFSPLPAYYSELKKDFRMPVVNDLATVDKESVVPIAKDTFVLENHVYEMSERILLLKEVEVTTKASAPKVEEKMASSLIVYDVTDKREDLIDKGEEPYDRIVDFLVATNPSFIVNNSKIGNVDDFYSDMGYYSYGGRPVMFLLDNKPLIAQAWSSVDNISMSRIEKIVISAVGSSPRTIYDQEGNYLTDKVVSMSDIEVIESYLGREGLKMPSSEYFDRSGRLKSNLVYIFLYSRYETRNVKQVKGIRTTLFDGFSVAREFFSPQYNYQIEANEANDHRRTLYWNPNVRSNEEGKASVFFFNNSTSNGFVINAESITEDGKMGVLEITN